MFDDLHISFDLDGTLIDTVPLMERCWCHTREKLKLKPTWEDYKANIGLHFDQICERLDLWDEREVVRDTYFQFSKELQSEIMLCNGVQEALTILQKRGISWSIITSKPRITAHDIIQRFQFKADVVIFADDVQYGKPHPEAAKLLKKSLNDELISKFVYIGDTDWDAEFAQNAKFEFFSFYQQGMHAESVNNQPRAKAKGHVVFNNMHSLITSILDVHSKEASTRNNNQAVFRG